MLSIWGLLAPEQEFVRCASGTSCEMFTRLKWHAVAPWQLASPSLAQIISFDPDSQPLTKDKLQHALCESWRSGRFAKFLNSLRLHTVEVQHCADNERRCALARKLASSSHQVAVLSGAFVSPARYAVMLHLEASDVHSCSWRSCQIVRLCMHCCQSGGARPACHLQYRLGWRGCPSTVPARCRPTLRSCNGLCIVVKHAEKFATSCLLPRLFRLPHAMPSFDFCSQKFTKLRIPFVFVSASRLPELPAHFHR